MAIERTFLGNERMTIDAKGRVAFPARFLAVLRQICPDQADAVGLVVSPDRSIKIMPLPAFEEALEAWRNLDDQVPEERMVLNMSTSLADVVQLDTQNRIKLNPEMMGFCEIDRQVVFTGNLQYMQLYDANVWREKVQENLKDLSDAAGKVARSKKEPQRPVQYVIDATPSPEKA